jgi:hypothetical protein
MIPEFTTVVGVDGSHLRQLATVWPTWRKHKRSTIVANPMLVFFDRTVVTADRIRALIDHPNMKTCAWPPEGIQYKGDDSSKWDNLQRHKMLSGFVHVPAVFVQTPYWLKLDTDVIATGMEDWIDPKWFDGDPAIISHPWCFTRPPDQMLKLDDWASNNMDELHMLHDTEPLKLMPKPYSDRVFHKRIISWCAFFNSAFNRQCAEAAKTTIGRCQIPVPSQDGFLFYCAKRMGLPIVRPRMKNCGWQVWATERNISRHVMEIMSEERDA